MIQFGDVSPDEQTWLVTHEVAHQWFYGLVGNNQAMDPWLDEEFATFVQLLVDGGGTAARYADVEAALADLPEALRVLRRDGALPTDGS